MSVARVLAKFCSGRKQLVGHAACSHLAKASCLLHFRLQCRFPRKRSALSRRHKLSIAWGEQETVVGYRCAFCIRHHQLRLLNSTCDARIKCARNSRHTHTQRSTGNMVASLLQLLQPSLHASSANASSVERRVSAEAGRMK